VQRADAAQRARHLLPPANLLGNLGRQLEEVERLGIVTHFKVEIADRTESLGLAGMVAELLVDLDGAQSVRAGRTVITHHTQRVAQVVVDLGLQAAVSSAFGQIERLLEVRQRLGGVIQQQVELANIGEGGRLAGCIFELAVDGERAQQVLQRLGVGTHDQVAAAHAVERCGDHGIVVAGSETFESFEEARYGLVEGFKLEAGAAFEQEGAAEDAPGFNSARNFRGNNLRQVGVAKHFQRLARQSHRMTRVGSGKQLGCV